jgi:xanthine dehydrogenase accessory factor
MNDLEIFREAASALKTGGNIALVTVISTTGSTPGKVGYKMLASAKNSETMGTVGGGLTEAQIIKMAVSMLSAPDSQVFRFDFGGTQEDEKGICGGSAEFLVETFDKRSLSLFEKLSTAIASGEKGVLISIISPRKPPEKIFLKDTDQIDATTIIEFSQEVITSIKGLAAKEQPAKILSGDGFEVFVETVAKQPPLIIFGAGHLSTHISRYAKSLNFTVTVCDDREQYANKERFPDADHIIVENFERAFDRIHIDSNSYIVIVARGHKYDEMILEQALMTNAKYIGMIGSKRKTLTILKRLNERGIPDQTLNRVYSPIGISIGAVTPEEIALSIVSELVKIRRIGDRPRTGHMTVSFSKMLNKENEGNL